ncbi:MAG: WD40 repeat domain-containing protein [Candidatus Latescibacteria bacterium]|nr:WD40 repeat domain-containing protein [Candidatus Latescibacterota bacterium]
MADRSRPQKIFRIAAIAAGTLALAALAAALIGEHAAAIGLGLLAIGSFLYGYKASRPPYHVIKTLSGHRDAVLAVAVIPNGAGVVAGGADQTISVLREHAA